MIRAALIVNQINTFLAVCRMDEMIIMNHLYNDLRRIEIKIQIYIYKIKRNFTLLSFHFDRIGHWTGAH